MTVIVGWGLTREISAQGLPAPTFDLTAPRSPCVHLNCDNSDYPFYYQEEIP